VSLGATRHSPGHPPRARWAPRVRTLVGLLFLLVLVLPFLLIGVQRLFENALILDTEHALLTEAVVVGEAYRAEVDPAAAAPLASPDDDAARYAPLVPRLDLAEAEVLPAATRRGEAVTATVTPSRLVPILERALVRNLSGIRVVDADGVVVASSARAHGYSLAHLPEVAAALAGDYQPVLRRRVSDEPPPPVTSLSRTADLRVSLAVPVFRDPRARPGTGAEVIGAVFASRTPLDTTQALWAWREKLYLPFWVSVLVTLGAVVFLSITLSRPLARLRAHAEQVAAGAPAEGYVVERVAPQEVHVLAEALERMSLQLAARADYIREFAANTAHELKTPLTSLRGAAELLLEAGDAVPAAQRARFLTNIQEDAVRMDRLVQRILELARIESTRPAREAVDLGRYLEGLAERYRRQGQPVTLTVDAPQVVLHAVPEQLESLFVNLMDNAARHGEGRPIAILVTRAAGEVAVAITDDGPPLAPGHLERVFERFYSTARAQGGTGLGLAIVKAVAEAHGGRVEAQAGARGATFRVVLPVAAR
jgi:signal transduction histidine kinase